jgi:hypothetical protein
MGGTYWQGIFVMAIEFEYDSTSTQIERNACLHVHACDQFTFMQRLKLFATWFFLSAGRFHH